MREDRAHQVLLRRLELHRDDEPLNELGDLRAHHVRADELAGLGIEDRLDETLSLTQRQRLAVGPEWETPDAHLAPLARRLGFRQSDRSNLRPAVGARRDAPRV